jgi:wyosine [tRNA(Phe)-imidazoG37] synthetase (radical SAM superfamily)
MRDSVILESASPSEERTFTSACFKCAHYISGDWKNSYLIGYVNLSMYPAPCQCRCSYCEVPKDHFDVLKDSGVAESYEKMFDALKYAIEIGLIAPKAWWQVSSGEIAIHPYRERIFEIVQNRTVMFYTNCFIFDSKIGANLTSNPASSINLSIDAGTKDTWHKVKGADNFGKIIENLAEYRNSSSRPGQITLKYIILPGINDNIKDYAAIIDLLIALGTNHLTLARDTRTKYGQSEEENERLVTAAGQLTAMLYQNKLTFNFDTFTFTPLEREKIVAATAKSFIFSRQT